MPDDIAVDSLLETDVGPCAVLRLMPEHTAGSTVGQGAVGCLTNQRQGVEMWDYLMASSCLVTISWD